MSAAPELVYGTIVYENLIAAHHRGHSPQLVGMTDGLQPYQVPRAKFRNYLYLQTTDWIPNSSNGCRLNGALGTEPRRDSFHNCKSRVMRHSVSRVVPAGQSFEPPRPPRTLVPCMKLAKNQNNDGVKFSSSTQTRMTDEREQHHFVCEFLCQQPADVPSCVRGTLSSSF